MYRLQPRRPRPHFLDLYRRPIGVRHGLSPSLALDAADTIPAGGQEPYLKTSAAGVLGGGLKGDLVAERFELADMVALGALWVDAGVVEAGAQVVEAGVGVGE